MARDAFDHDPYEDDPTVETDSDETREQARVRREIELRIHQARGVADDPGAARAIIGATLWDWFSRAEGFDWDSVFRLAPFELVDLTERMAKVFQEFGQAFPESAPAAIAPGVVTQKDLLCVLAYCCGGRLSQWFLERARPLRLKAKIAVHICEELKAQCDRDTLEQEQLFERTLLKRLRDEEKRDESGPLELLRDSLRRV